MPRVYPWSTSCDFQELLPEAKAGKCHQGICGIVLQLDGLHLWTSGFATQLLNSANKASLTTIPQAAFECEPGVTDKLLHAQATGMLQCGTLRLMHCSYEDQAGHVWASWTASCALPCPNGCFTTYFTESMIAG